MSRRILVPWWRVRPSRVYVCVRVLLCPGQRDDELRRLSTGQLLLRRCCGKSTMLFRAVAVWHARHVRGGRRLDTAKQPPVPDAGLHDRGDGVVLVVIQSTQRHEF